jgi:hypothetical protein
MDAVESGSDNRTSEGEVQDIWLHLVVASQEGVANARAAA